MPHQHDKNQIRPALMLLPLTDPEAILSDLDMTDTILPVDPEVLLVVRLLLDLSTLRIGEAMIVIAGGNVIDLLQMIDQNLEVVRGSYLLMLWRISEKILEMVSGMSPRLNYEFKLTLVVMTDLDIPTLHLIRMLEIDLIHAQPTAISQIRHLVEVHLLLHVLRNLPLSQPPLVPPLLSLRPWLFLELKSPR
jgi:hypothetical protein